MTAVARPEHHSNAKSRPGRKPLPLTARLFAPVDAASLVFFRITFGAFMLWEVWCFWRYGWIEHDYLAPAFHFSYPGFDWVRPWPGAGLYWHFLVLGAAAGCVLLGWFYRAAAFVFFLGFSYVFLLDAVHYLNHEYLICLLAFLLIFVPAHRAFSLDAWWRPAHRSPHVPAWVLWLLRFQIAVPYVYGGLAKLDSDWLRGEPIRGMLARLASDWPLLGLCSTRRSWSTSSSTAACCSISWSSPHCCGGGRGRWPSPPQYSSI